MKQKNSTRLLHPAKTAFQGSWSGYLSKLVALVLLVGGLIISDNAYAQIPAGQSVATIRNVIVTAGTSSSSATTNTYDAIPTTGGSGIGGGIFGGTNFGTLDLSAASLLLQGGTVQITEAAGETYNNVYIQYGVAQGTTSPALTTANSIQLIQTSYDAGTMTRTFSLNNAARNILALAATGGTGTTYRFDITVNAYGSDANGDDVIVTGTASRRRSSFIATGTQPIQPSVTANTITISPNGGSANSANGGADVIYNINPSNPRPFQGANLSSSSNSGTTYDVNNGQLSLTGTTVTTTESGTSVINNVVLYYRTRATNSSGGQFQAITLTQSGNTTNGTRTFVLDPNNSNNTINQPNLISTQAVTAAGTYVVEVYYQANGYNSNTGASITITDPPTSNTYYSANFTVSGTPIAQTIWTGGKNDNWFDAANWSNGIPTRSTNALIRDLGAGSSVPYPNIYSDDRVTTAAGILLYDNTGSGPAEALNLTMSGTSQASRSIARLSVGRLRVFGNFNNSFDSFVQRENTVVEFAGGNQTITGGTFVAVEISGGGNKFDMGLMTVSQSINFISGLLTTDITAPTTSFVLLASGTVDNNYVGGQLLNETDHNYLRGFVRTSIISIPNGQTANYGNTGMKIAFNGTNSPGSVEVTRNTVEVYNPLPDAYSIRRIFGVRPADQATSTGGLNATIIFGYQNIDTRQLAAGSATGTVSIPEQNLALFNSQNSGNSFNGLGRDVLDTLNNTLTKYNVRLFATFTLGDLAHPLPVTLVAFNAVRSGANTLLSWTTASEQNNKGFNVQVSADGVTYHTLAFVASKSPNSSNELSYKYTDTEAGKTGTRYYRLEQVDIDGTVNYSPVRAVGFDGAAATAVALVAYPNPFSDTIGLTVEGATTTEGSAYVKLVDMTGRTVLDQKVSLAGASLTLGDLSNLRSGLYLAKVTLPDGSVQTVRVQKQ